MASEWLEVSPRPQKRPDTPEFQAQVERSQLKSQVWRSWLMNEWVQEITEDELLSWSTDYHLNVWSFDPTTSEQYLPGSVSEETLDILKDSRESIAYRLHEMIEYSDRPYPWIGLSGDAEWLLWFFFSDFKQDQQGWDKMWASPFYNAQEFNHKIALLPESVWISPIDISPKTLGKIISQEYEEFEKKRFPASNIEDYIKWYVKASERESIPGKNTKEYVDLCSDALYEISSNYEDYLKSFKAFHALPLDIRAEINYDIKWALNKASNLRDDCIKVLLQDNWEWGYKWIEFDWSLSQSEIQIAQYGLEKANISWVLNGHMEILPLDEWGYVLEESIFNLDGVLGFLQKHPNKKIRDIIINEMKQYWHTLGLRNGIDGNLWNQTFLMIAAYQYQKYWNYHSKVTGKLNKETMLSLAAEAKNAL